MPMQSSDSINASQHKMAMINAIRDITDPRLKGLPKLLLIMLITRTEPFGLASSPLYDELAADTGTSFLKCQEAARTLETLGYVKREGRAGRSNIFHIRETYILRKADISRLNDTSLGEFQSVACVAQSYKPGEVLGQLLAVRNERVPLDGAEFFKYLDSAPKQDVR